MSHDRRTTLGRLLAGGALLAFLPRAAMARDPEVYAYDALGRLTSVTYDNGDVLYYVYDAAGNRTQVQRNGTPPAPPSPPGPPTPSTLAVGVTATTWLSSPVTGEDPPVAALVSGGVPPYSFTWQRVSGLATVQPNTPNASWTEWVWTGSNPTPPTKQATWRCRVIDAASTTVYSPNVVATIDLS